MRAFIIAALAAPALISPAMADDRTFEFLGAHGCTVGAQSMDALADAGFLEPYTRQIIDNALSNGVAKQQGDYVVLDASICTIRLPEIFSEFTVDSPEIRAIAPYMRDSYILGDGTEIVNEGCFAIEAYDTFQALYPDDPDAANLAYLQFLASTISSGDLRFYSPSPLSTPVSFQITTGDCARAPNIDAINASKPYIVSGFGDYIRRLGAETSCGDSGTAFANPMLISAEIQGADLSIGAEMDPNINVNLFFEWDLITIGAGWHEGMSATQRGEPRPPLCHYPG